jgi:hypothetical protein
MVIDHFKTGNLALLQWEKNAGTSTSNIKSSQCHLMAQADHCLKKKSYSDIRLSSGDHLGVKLTQKDLAVETLRMVLKRPKAGD